MFKSTTLYKFFTHICEGDKIDEGPGAWGGGGPLLPTLFRLVGSAPPKTSTPQDSPQVSMEIHTRYVRKGKWPYLSVYQYQ